MNKKKAVGAGREREYGERERRRTTESLGGNV